MQKALPSARWLRMVASLSKPRTNTTPEPIKGSKSASRKESASRKRKRFARAPRGPLGGPFLNSAIEKGYLSFQINILRIFILKNKK